MADQPIIDVSGLQVANNTFTASPPGSLIRADNAVMPQKGVIEMRRGFSNSGTMPTAAELPFAVTEFLGSIIDNYSATKNGSSYGLGVNANPVTGYSGGPYNPVDAPGSLSAARMKFAQAAGYLYFCTTTGPKCLEAAVGPPRAAGLLRMPDITATLSSDSVYPANNWLPDGLSVAYRSVLRKPTSSGVSLLSPPSGRTVVGNAIVAPVGSMVRAGAVVTVTFPGSASPLLTGDTLTLSPGEANFPAGAYTVASDAANVITYASAGAAVANTIAQTFLGGPTTTTMFIYLSEDATTETPVRLYRSLAAVAPSDELFLVDEMFPTAMQITQGYITYDDTTPDSVLSTNPLYTNPQTGEGAAQANNQPPVYRDTTSWGERLWYANTTSQQAFRLEMLGVGSPEGVQNNDTITIDDGSGFPVTFTFKNTVAAATDVQIVSNGLPSFNIQQTTQNIVRAITSVMDFNGVPIRAYGMSEQDGSQGKVLLETIDYSAGAFSLLASRPGSWVPALDPALPVSSSNERVPHGLSYSKLAQPEAVAPVNFTTVGSRNYPIRRILGLQNALLIFKEGDGIYSMTGSFPFQLQQISVANIIAPDAACVLADAAWVYTDQGILRVSQAGGSTVVSRPIETLLNELQALSTTRLHDYAFAVPYETERRVYFYVPNGEQTLGNGLPEMIAFAYNNATQAWTGPLTPNAFSGVVNTSTNKLVLGVYDDVRATGRTFLERKTGTHYDYAGPAFTAQLTEINVGGNPRVVRFADDTDIEVGDGFIKLAFRSRIIAERTDLGARYFELGETGTLSLTPSSCVIDKAIPFAVQFQPIGNPSVRKTVSRLAYLFKPGEFASVLGNAIIATDQIQADLSVRTVYKGFGSTPFGTGPFGNPTPLVVDLNTNDAKWTNAAQYFPGFVLQEAWPKFKLQGVVLNTVTNESTVARGK